MNDLKRHVPLYLKHRPQTLEQLVGQTAVLTTLTNAINHDRISHAYLFTGPRGTGKTSSARILAKSLNCKAAEKATVTPCLECTSCEEIKNCSSPAVIEIDAASNNSVDDARVLIERAPLVAPGARYKIYIIDECHMLTKEAFNALLKTIEDPPPNVVFILATTEEHKVLPTIVSRCQRLMFRLVTQDDLLLHLKNVAAKENIEITDLAIDFIARRSGGGMRDALGLLDQASLLSAPGQPVDVKDLLNLLGALQEDVLAEMSEHILNRRGHELLTAAGNLLRDGREPAIVVQELARHFLNLAKASYLADLPNRAEVVASLIVGSPSYLEGLWEQAPKFERSELSQMVEMLDRLEGTCRRTTQPAMHLEVGLLALCHRQDMILIRELSERVARLEQGAPAPRVAAGPMPTSRAAGTGATGTGATGTGATGTGATGTGATGTGATGTGATGTGATGTGATGTGATGTGATGIGATGIGATGTGATGTGATGTGATGIGATGTWATGTGATGIGATGTGATSATARGAMATPAPVAVPAASAASEAGRGDPRSGSGRDEPSESSLARAADNCASPDEVDRVWSAVLDELSRRNLPAFSIVQQHAFPLELTDRDFTIGVKEALLKSVEAKSDHLKAACAAAVGKQLNIKLKPTTMASSAPPPAPSQSRPAPAPREYSSPAPVAASVGGGQTDNGGDYDDEPDLDRRIKIDDAAEPGAAAPAPAATADRGNDATIIKEAYKLFEGPGSRQIG